MERAEQTKAAKLRAECEPVESRTIREVEARREQMRRVTERVTERVRR